MDSHKKKNLIYPEIPGNISFIDIRRGKTLIKIYILYFWLSQETVLSCKRMRCKFDYPASLQHHQNAGNAIEKEVKIYRKSKMEIYFSDLYGNSGERHDRSNCGFHWIRWGYSKNQLHPPLRPLSIISKEPLLHGLTARTPQIYRNPLWKFSI